MVVLDMLRHFRLCRFVGTRERDESGRGPRQVGAARGAAGPDPHSLFGLEGDRVRVCGWVALT